MNGIGIMSALGLGSRSAKARNEPAQIESRRQHPQPVVTLPNAVPAPEPALNEPMCTASAKPEAPTATPARERRRPRTAWHPAHVQAAQLIDFLQSEGGMTGLIAWSDLSEIHLEMCQLLDWQAASWVAVSRELRRALGDDRRYAVVNGRRTRCFNVPPGPGSRDGLPATIDARASA